MFSLSSIDNPQSHGLVNFAQVGERQSRLNSADYQIKELDELNVIERRKGDGKGALPAFHCNQHITFNEFLPNGSRRAALSPHRVDIEGRG